MYDSVKFLNWNTNEHLYSKGTIIFANRTQ